MSSTSIKRLARRAAALPCVCLAAVGVLGACGPGAATAGPGQEAAWLTQGPVPFRVLIPIPGGRRGGWEFHSGLPALHAVVRSEAEWAALLDHLVERPPVEVDFEAEMLLVAAAGRTDFGPLMVIDSVYVADDTIRVLVAEHVPPPRAPTLMMAGTPWTVAAMPRAANPVVFVERKIQH
jgi:hypothetical protein